MKKVNKTQSKIVNAAKEEYRLNGYSNTSFQSIAQRSDTSKSLINYYFPKKQDILVMSLAVYTEEIYSYVSAMNQYDALMRSFLARTIYFKSLQSYADWRAFENDIHENAQFDISLHKNILFEYEAIHSEFELYYNTDVLFQKSLSSYGITRQLYGAYNAGKLQLTYDELIERILFDTSNLFQLNNYTVHLYLNRLWDEYNGFDKKVFSYF